LAKDDSDSIGPVDFEVGIVITPGLAIPKFELGDRRYSTLDREKPLAKLVSF
jgi:hypothetical protein